MRLRIIAVLGLMVIGLGAVAFALVGPGAGGQAATQYLTATATRGTVAAQSVATGSIAANAVYGLAFGSEPALVSTSSSSSSSSSSSGGGGTTSWPVTSVDVKVGDKVTMDQVLATADDADARLAVTAAEASLASAKARLASDSKGADAATKQSAADSVAQARLQLAQAQRNRTNTRNQNALSLKQAQAAVTRARQKLLEDGRAGAPAATTAADQNAWTQARDSLASTQVRVAASNDQADAQVTSAQQGLTFALHGYSTKIAPATSTVIQGDKAAVATAEANLASVQATLAAAQVRAPADGVIVAVNIVPGALAPSGYAIQLQAGPMIVSASFSETDIVKLKPDQPASVTVGAAGATVDGIVTQIAPVAAGTSGSSVVTYAVKITLSNPPANVLAGMSASVAVTTAQADNVVTVPAQALTGSAGRYGVRVIGPDGQATIRSVDVGLVTSSMAEIRSGVNEGDTVAIGTVSARTGTTTTTGGGGFGGGGGGIVIPGGGLPGGRN
jgi:multidrug efflux pump subunit AcrA (membrane-fusion protein)